MQTQQTVHFCINKLKWFALLHCVSTDTGDKLAAKTTSHTIKKKTKNLQQQQKKTTETKIRNSSLKREEWLLVQKCSAEKITIHMELACTLHIYSAALCYVNC